MKEKKITEYIKEFVDYVDLWNLEKKENPDLVFEEDREYTFENFIKWLYWKYPENF